MSRANPMPNDRREAIYRRQGGRWLSPRQSRRWAKKGIREEVREELRHQQSMFNAEQAGLAAR